jgi:transposase
VPEEITAAQAARILGSVKPYGTAGQARCDLAAELLADMRRLDEQMRESKKKLAAAVRASGTSLTELFGVGPVVAATVIGDAADVSRFASRDHFAAYNGTAPIEVSSGNRKIYRLSLRGNRRVNHAIQMAAITQIRHAHSDGRAYYDKKLAEGKTHKRRSGPSSAGSATPSTPASAPTPASPPAARTRAREGNRGTTLTPARPAHTPNVGSSDKPLPDLTPPYGPPPRPGRPCRRNQSRRRSAVVLDNDRKEDSIWAVSAVSWRSVATPQSRSFCGAGRELTRVTKILDPIPAVGQPRA